MPERCHQDHFGVFIANFEQIYCSNPVLLLFTLYMHLFAAPCILYSAKTNLFEVSNGSTSTRYELCSKLTINTSERHLMASFWYLYC